MRRLRRWYIPCQCHCLLHCDRLTHSTCVSEFVCLDVFVCVFICQEDYCRSNQLISLKLYVLIGPTSVKNWLTLGGIRCWIRIPKHFFTNFSIAEQGILGDWFINISPTTWTKWPRPTRERIHYILGAIWQTPRSGSVCGSPDSYPRWLLVEATEVQVVRCTWHWRRCALSECCPVVSSAVVVGM